MDAQETNMSLVRAYMGAVERFDATEVGALLHPEIVQTEYPNRLNPKGQVRGYDQMLADLPRGAKVLQRQSYSIDMFAAGDRVTLESRWDGVIAVPLGGMQPGDTMTAHICMVFTIRDGRIVAQKNYDCYEPF